MSEKFFWQAKSLVNDPPIKPGAPSNRHWHRIGSAKGTDDDVVEVTINVVPLNWDGRFTLFPCEPGGGEE